MAEKDSESVENGKVFSVIGCGTMATAILSGVMEACKMDIKAGKKPRFSRFIATVQSGVSATRLQEKFGDNIRIIQGDNIAAMDQGDVILFGFKPYMIDLVLDQNQIMNALQNKLVISVLVGSPIEKLKAAIFNKEKNNAPVLEVNDSIYIKRAMPNLAVEFREGMTVIETDPTNTNPEFDEITEWIFLQLGKIQVVSPNLYDVGGVLAGAAGGFLTIAIDGMLDGAVSEGMKRADAAKILNQTMLSISKLLENEHPAVLREKFSSPKGTTIAGLLSLEEDRARHAFTKAVIASSKRSEEIGKTV